MVTEEEKKVRELTDSEKELVEAYSFNAMVSHKFDSNANNPKYAGISEDDWRKMIAERIDTIVKNRKDEIDLLAYIYHDKDKPDDEEKEDEKGLHAHILVRFKKGHKKTVGEVRELFGVNDRSANCQKVVSLVGSSRYLTHRTDDAMDAGKYQYSVDEVITYNVKYVDMIRRSFWGTEKNDFVAPEKAKEIMYDYSEKVYLGELRKDEAIDKLHRELGYRYRKQWRDSFDGDQKDFIRRRVKELSENGRNNTNIFIMGDGGIGKTNMGRKLGVKLSEGKGFYVTAPLGVSKTPDALNHYTDEMVALFNEISPQGWTIDEFNACFDFHEYAPFPARNENKHFIGHTSIFTNSISPLRFAKDLLIFAKGGSEYQDPANKREINMNNPTAVDKYWQVRRRLKHLIVLVRDEVNDDVVHAHVFNLRYGLKKDDGSFVKDNGTHVRVGEVTFENRPEEEPTINNDTLNRINELFKVSVKGTHDDKSFEPIESFLERHGLTDTAEDVVIQSFIEDVISESKWDLLPTEFLYDLYKSFVKRFYPQENILNVKEFIYAFETHAVDWVWASNAVRSKTKMKADEPLITEYNLVDWTDKSYHGSDLVKRRDFKRKERYRGFVRK